MSITGGTHITVGYVDGNNVIASVGQRSCAGALENIVESGSRYDFGIKWSGDDAARNTIVPADFDTGPGALAQPSVGLIRGIHPKPGGVGIDTYKSGFGQLDDGSDFEAALLSVDWDNGTLAGTIKELYYVATYGISGAFVTVTGRTLVATRDNVDPGYGAIGAGRGGSRYSFAVTGTELRVYNDRETSAVVIAASPPSFSAFALFPLTLGVHTSDGYHVSDVRIFRARPDRVSTIYSARDRAADGISSGLHIRLFQNPTPPLTVRGAVVDVDVT